MHSIKDGLAHSLKLENETITFMYIFTLYIFFFFQQCVTYSIAGFFMEPTIFTNVEDENFIAVEESFGPVMIISIFENGCVNALVFVAEVEIRLRI